MRSLEHCCLTPSDLGEGRLWDSFVASSPLGTLYHSTSWLRGLAEGMGQDVRLHVLRDREAIVAGAVVRCAEKCGVRKACKPWATAYNGIIVSEGAGSAIADELVAHLRSHYHHVRLVGGPQGGGQTSIPSGVRVTPMINLADPDVLWNSFDRRARQRVRKAQKLGITVRETEEAHTFYDLYSMTYVRQGLSMPLCKEAVVRTLSTARDLGALRLFEARTASAEPAVALVVGEDTKRAYFMLAGSHPELRKTDAMSLLWWETMKLYAQTHQELDLVGLGTPTIERFKRCFSPSYVPTPEIEFYSSRWSAAALNGASFGRRCVGTLKGYVGR